jgi:hypothetical protein
MTNERSGVRKGVLGAVSIALVGVLFVGTALAAPAGGASESSSPGLIFATSEIAQVMLSVGAVGFVILSARAYGGEIGKALYVAGGGVIIFATWQLLHGASRILQLQRPPENVGSAINLVVTVLLLAGFYMLYETIHGHSTV